MPAYDAFISYSHAKDMPIATALQSVIQTLGKPWYRRRALRVFRDDTSLSATPHLWPSIEEALSQSRFLVLLASPEAAASRWVNQEAAYWLAHKSIDTLLIALTDGTLTWDREAGDFQWSKDTPLPAALKSRSLAEPRWIELQVYRGEVRPRDAKFQELAANFAAAIRGIPKEDLLSQEIRQQRRALRHAWSAVALLVALTCAALWGWRAAVVQRDRAERTLAAATATANDLVMDVAVKIRNRLGIPVELTREIITRAGDLLNKLSQASGISQELRHDIARALRELATTSLAAGDIAKAREAAKQSLDIMQALSAERPENAQWQRELSLSYNRIGEVQARASERDDALKSFRLALEIREKLAQSVPENNEWQRDLAVSYERVGDERMVVGEIDEALRLYQNALDIRTNLARDNPENKVWSRDLSVSYEKIGDISSRTDELEAALENYNKSLHIRALLATDAANAEAQRDVAVSRARIGDVQRRMNRPEQAIASYRESLAIRQTLASTDAGNVTWQIDLISILLKLTESGDAGAPGYALAAEIARRLAGEGKLPRGLKLELERLESRAPQP